AVDRIRSGTSVNSRLKQLLLDPAIAEKPKDTSELALSVIRDLDDSKRSAVKAALGSSDVLLVEGPPGTGKTQFIVALIAEEVRRNPKTRILLAAQTHIAIDNALERLDKNASPMNILRIASDSSRAVAEGSAKFLLGQQMAQWGEEVYRRSTEGLER